jgi:MarR family transcriptional regulator, organic hydroperoxide resistance regulator
MSTVSQLFTEPSAIRLEQLLEGVVWGINAKRQNVLSQYNVGELEVRIISYLDAQDEKKMKEVGEHFKIKLSTLTSTIDKLEKNKLVKRKNSKDDRRVIFIKPTARGQKLLVELAEITRSLAESLVQESNAAEFDSVARALEKMRQLVQSS